MTAYDTAAAVLAAAASVDTRTPHPDPAIITMWAGILGDINRGDALQAVARHYTRPGVERLLPGDVLDGVRRIRSERLRDVPSSDLDPPDVDPGDVPAWLEARRARVAAIADGTVIRPSAQPASVEGQRRVAAEIEGRAGLPDDVRNVFAQAEQAARKRRAETLRAAEEVKARKQARVEAARAELARHNSDAADTAAAEG
jgi:hypothetical protein